MWLLLIQLHALFKCRPVSRNYQMEDISIKHFSKLDGSLHSRRSINKFRRCETDEKHNQPSENNFSSVSIRPPLLSWYKYERALTYAPHRLVLRTQRWRSYARCSFYYKYITPAMYMYRRKLLFRASRCLLT